MNTCRNCKEPIHANFCPNCGQTANLQRIDRGFIFREIAGAFNVNRGILFTIKKMLISPGDSIRQYLTEDRIRYVKPIAFVIITSLIYTVISQFFQVDGREFHQQLAGGTEGLEVLPTAELFTDWAINYSGYANIIIGFFMAFWVKLLFRKSGYNLFEIFVLYCYITGITTLFSSVAFIIQGLTHWNLIQITLFITLIYTIWATAQFFDKKKVGSYIKATLSYVLGFIAFSFLLGFVIILVDIILKQ